jgi:hypothetical protein
MIMSKYYLMRVLLLILHSHSPRSVVTVHGIRDDYRTAWTDAKGAWWVKDQLFQNMSTREVDYCYEIDPASTLYEPGGIMQHARALISKYARLRDELEEVSSLQCPSYVAGIGNTSC